MSKSNGHDVDEGLVALREAFKDAQYISVEAKDCADQIMLGAHRVQEIPDAVIMEVYGSITEGKNIQLTFAADSGGYVANIESYTDLIAMMAGTLEAIPTEAPANDPQV